MSIGLDYRLVSKWAQAIFEIYDNQVYWYKSGGVGSVLNFVGL